MINFHSAATLKSMTKDVNKVRAAALFDDFFTYEQVDNYMFDAVSDGKYSCVIETRVIAKEVCDELADLILKSNILKTLSNNGYEACIRKDKEEYTFDSYRIKMFIKWED